MAPKSRDSPCAACRVLPRTQLKPVYAAARLRAGSGLESCVRVSATAGRAVAALVPPTGIEHRPENRMVACSCCGAGCTIPRFIPRFRWRYPRTRPAPARLQPGCAGVRPVCAAPRRVAVAARRPAEGQEKFSAWVQACGLPRPAPDFRHPPRPAVRRLSASAGRLRRQRRCGARCRRRAGTRATPALRPRRGCDRTRSPARQRAWLVLLRTRRPRRPRWRRQLRGSHGSSPGSACASAHSSSASASASLSSAGAWPRARMAAMTSALPALPRPVTWRLIVPTGTP